MFSTFDLAYVISRCLVIGGCVGCAIAATRSKTARPLAWLAVATMSLALLLGVMPTLFLPVVVEGSQGVSIINSHEPWQGWSGIFFGVGAALFLIAIIVGDQSRRSLETQQEASR